MKYKYLGKIPYPSLWLNLLGFSISTNISNLSTPKQEKDYWLYTGNIGTSTLYWLGFKIKVIK